MMQHSGNKEFDLNTINKLKKYFPNCSALYSKMIQNIEKAKTYETKQSGDVYHDYYIERSEDGFPMPNKIVSQGINNFNCN